MICEKVSEDIIADDELLYRSVKRNQEGQPQLYRYQEDGKLIVSASAFNDRYRRPSVDRASLREHDPKRTMKSETDGVLNLLTHEIRKEKIDVMAPGGQTIGVSYQMDVKPEPLQEPEINPAHAVIVSNPDYKTGRSFEKVKERLAILATRRGFSIKPK